MKSCYYLFFILFVSVTSCKNQSGKYEELKNLNDSTSFTGLSGDSVKLVKTASINFKVKNVEQGSIAVSALAQKYGGMIYHKNLQSAINDKKELKVSDDSVMVVSTITPVAEMTVRVPSQHLEIFLLDVASVGYYTGSSQLNIEDKSLHYLENMLSEKNRREELSPTKKSNSDSLQTIQTIQVKDDAIQQFIANKNIDADAAYSNVSLNLFQNAIVAKEMIANYDLASYQLPFGERLKNSLRHGWEAFVSFFLAILNLWVFILASLLVFYSYRYASKRKMIKLPAKV